MHGPYNIKTKLQVSFTLFTSLSWLPFAVSLFAATTCPLTEITHRNGNKYSIAEYTASELFITITGLP
jgi:hypothetical protein